MQKKRKIVIKACDKGADVIILNFKDDLKSCSQHLVSRIEIEGEEPQYYYKQVNALELGKAKAKIQEVPDEALENEIITTEEHQTMDPEDKDPAKFYALFKIHKEHLNGETPPLRPIVSGSGSLSEGIATVVEHYLKEIASSHKTYLQDTSDHIRNVEKINEGSALSVNSILLTVEIKGAYLNIPQVDGIDCLQEALEVRSDKSIPSGFISRLMELILKYNFFNLTTTFLNNSLEKPWEVNRPRHMLIFPWLEELMVKY